MVWKFLQHCMDAFITENTFNVNGDYKEYGLVSFMPIELSEAMWGIEVSLDGGFCGAAAVLEMLLQRWNGKIFQPFRAVHRFLPLLLR